MKGRRDLECFEHVKFIPYFGMMQPVSGRSCFEVVVERLTQGVVLYNHVHKTVH